MPKLKQLVAELDELQRKLSDVEASMSKATSVLELQLFELEETKLVEAYQRKNAELLRKKQRLRKKEFALGQQTGTSIISSINIHAFHGSFRCMEAENGPITTNRSFTLTHGHTCVSLYAHYWLWTWNRDVACSN
jgi:hypothetical protein